MTRAMFASMLYRLANEPVVEGDTLFKDVKANMWYTDATIWANKEGIIKGMDAKVFAPNKEVTREQMAVMLYNYLKMNGQTLALENEAVDLGDIKVSDWAKEAMTFMIQAGIMKGDNKGSYNPKAKATRAEVSEMMYRLMTALESK